MQSFYLVIFLAAKFNIRLQSKDVTGAFLNANLADHEKEFVVISKKHAEILVKVDNNLKDFVRPNGTIIAKPGASIYAMSNALMA